MPANPPASAPKKGVDVSSPFFLAPSDNPGATITSFLLTSDIFDIWEKAMLNDVKAKNKIGFINGAITQPLPDTPEAECWETCNSMLISWIMNSIDKVIQPSVAYLDSTKAVWDNLHEYFAVGNTPRIYELRNEIDSFRQQGMTVIAYYTKLKGIWDELSSHSKVPHCTCGLAREFLREKEEEKLHQFLMDLEDDIFWTVRSQIHNMDPLPSLSKVYSLVTREEWHRTIVRGQDSRGENVAMDMHTSANHRPSGSYNSKSHGGEHQRPSRDKKCTHCHKSGHDVTEYFKLHGYSTWFKGKRIQEPSDMGRNHAQQACSLVHAAKATIASSTRGGSSASLPSLSHDQI